MALEFNRKTGSDSEIYDNTLTYAKAKAVIEHMEGEPVLFVKTFKKEDSDNAFVIWQFAGGDYVTSPCGPSVVPGMSPKELTYGYNEDMDIFVGYARSEDETLETA